MICEGLESIRRIVEECFLFLLLICEVVWGIQGTDVMTESVCKEEVTQSVYSDEIYYPYYQMISPGEKVIYQQIYNCARGLVETFEPYTVVSVDEVGRAFEAVFNDHPELFWLTSEYSCSYFENKNCVEVTLQYNSLSKNRDAAQAEIDVVKSQILHGIHEKMTDAEKERYVYDELISRMIYDVSAPEEQILYSALVEGRGVCAGYARAFQYLMMELEIPCYYCTGYAKENHAWNIILIDGVYYNVDVTWGDTNHPNYEFYNQLDVVYQETHQRSGLSKKLPVCKRLA